MPVFSILPTDTIKLQTTEETAMGVHVAKWHGENYCLVFGCTFAVAIDSEALEQVARFSEARWYAPGFSWHQQEETFGGWLHSLMPRPIATIRAEEAVDALQYVARGLPPPKASPMPSTHLPHTIQSAADSVFYRWESVPTSKKVNQKSNQILPGTFAAPHSELPFCPTGLAVVARYALPSIMPAQWRWEIKPPTSTTFKCGASIPLNGQSGGGVEVMFPALFKNEGPIANPVVLPIL